MIVNETHRLMGDYYSIKVKLLAFLEFMFLIVLVVLKRFTELIENLYTLSVISAIFISLLFLYYLYLITFYDLRMIYLNRLIKKHFNYEIRHLNVLKKDNQEDLVEFYAQLDKLTHMFNIINNREIIYTNSVIVSDDVKLIMIISTRKSKEYIYEIKS